MTPEATLAIGIFVILAVLWLGYVVIDRMARKYDDPDYDSHYLAEDEEDDSEQGTPPEQSAKPR